MFLFSVKGRGLATKITVPTTLFVPFHWDPNANHSITTMGGWAGQVPEGRDSTPMPSRKKERYIYIGSRCPISTSSPSGRVRGEGSYCAHETGPPTSPKK